MNVLQTDKGQYSTKPQSRAIVVRRKDVIDWNSTQNGQMSDISQVFKMDDIFILWMAIWIPNLASLWPNADSFLLRMYFFLPKFPFKPLFDAIISVLCIMPKCSYGPTPNNHKWPPDPNLNTKGSHQTASPLQNHYKL